MMDLRKNNRNKQIVFMECGKVTRNDNLSRHMKTHSNPIYKTMKEINEEQQITKRRLPRKDGYWASSL